MAREMKDSGIEWIGEIPADWEKNKIIRIFETIGSGTTPKANNELDFDGEVYWIQSGDITGNYILTAKNKISRSTVEKYSALKVYAAPFIVVAMYGASIGNLAISNINACVNQACCVLKGSNIDFRFSYYTLQAAQNHLIQQGIGGGQPNISQEVIKQLWIPIPQQDEQERVSHFLDKKCAEIDAVLDKTRTSIEEYKKLKQAIITQAVTKGVRGDRPMKESGIDWADVIPEEIKISRLGLHYDIILGKMLCSAQVDDSYTLEPYYCAADVHFEGISDSERKMMWFSPAEKELYLVRRNDLLVVEGGAGAGGCAVVTDEETPTYIQNSIMIVRAKHSGDCRYVRYWLECLVRQGYIDVVCNKATIPHFTKDKLAAVPYFVFSEQERNEISDYLDEQCRNINSQVGKKECLLHELESYKKSLIYEYVTGKKEAPQA